MVYQVSAKFKLVFQRVALKILWFRPLATVKVTRRDQYELIYHINSLYLVSQLVNVACYELHYFEKQNNATWSSF
jgi:hypothetical protein